MLLVEDKIEGAGNTSKMESQAATSSNSSNYFKPTSIQLSIYVLVVTGIVADVAIMVTTTRMSRRATKNEKNEKPISTIAYTIISPFQPSN